MTSPQLLLESLENSLKEWEIFGRRAQLEAIMPVVDSLTQHKVSCTVLAKMLAERNCEIKADTLRQSLHRWRKKHSIPSADTNVSKQGSLSTTSSTPSATTAGPHAQQEDLSAKGTGRLASHSGPAKILTKAGLAEIRDGHVDLEEIKRAGRRLAGS